MKKTTTSAAIIKLANRIDNELKALLEADLKSIRRIQNNVIGTINPEANIFRPLIA